MAMTIAIKPQIAKMIVIARGLITLSWASTNSRVADSLGLSTGQHRLGDGVFT